MKNDIVAIHQFTPTIADRDGVTNAVILTQKLLKELGFISDIYTRTKLFDETFKHNILHIDEYKEDENQLLLYHHSIGHEYHDMIMNFADQKILVYHNITPEHFFLKETNLQKLCTQGREQLKKSKDFFISSYADSTYNLQELKSYNYKKAIVLPLLSYIKQLDNTPLSQKILTKYQNSYNILFVGRIATNKCQHQLVDVIYHLKQQNIQNIKLLIVGGVTQRDYYNFLCKYIENLNLNNEVVVTNKVDDKDLHSYYKSADLYLSLSEHEGFGIPLLEAMQYDMPVLSYNAGGVATALGDKGLLNYKAPDRVAQKIIEIMKNPYKRVEIIKYQKEHLKKFSYEHLKNEFAKYLKTIGLNIPSKKTPDNSLQTKPNYQIEGPFDSSYSLAIVNDNLAKSLHSCQDNVRLYSTEGDGDFEPNKEFLKTDKISNTLYQNKLKNIDITIRNLYPPRTNAMSGYHKIIGPYGWEESSFPKEYVEGFNRRLSLLTCMSEYVKDVMLKNGVTIPLYVTGIGVDHILNYEPKKIKYALPKGFKLLHISSCFPRKGIGILLNVFEKLVQDGVDVSLVIKTFPNPHNNILNMLKKLPLHVSKKILLINEELEPSQINYLYQNCDSLVAPSKGEGFGLPMAEAMLFDLPVITTAYGGQVDFCKPDNSWLVDYSFEKAETHMQLFNSFWVAPCPKSLEENILKVYNANEDEKKQKTHKAKQFILKNYKWKDVIDRLKQALKDFDTSKKETKIKVAWISSFNTKCGIASYSKSLLEQIQQYFESLSIFANKVDNNQILDTKIEKGIVRNWGNRFDKDNRQLINDLKSNSYTDIVIQFNFGFFSIQNLQQIIKENLDKKITIEFHSVKDIKIKEVQISLAEAKNELKDIHQIIVHNIEDLNILKSFDLVKNVILLPLGVSDIPERKNEKNEKFTLATYGFLLPQKGIVELIEAFAHVKKAIPNAHLLLLNSLYPIELSNNYLKECQEKIKSLNLSQSITFRYDYLSNKESMSLLSNADLLVLAYKKTQESASAAVRELIATKRPILCTKQNIFNDVSDIIHFTKGLNPNDIADSIINLYHDEVKLNSKKQKQKEWISEHSWENTSQKFINILKRTIQ